MAWISMEDPKWWQISCSRARICSPLNQTELFLFTLNRRLHSKDVALEFYLKRMNSIFLPQVIPSGDQIIFWYVLFQLLQLLQRPLIAHELATIDCTLIFHEGKVFPSFENVGGKCICSYWTQCEVSSQKKKDFFSFLRWCVIDIPCYFSLMLW